ncbi:uncharacterized protein BDV17DRAFT_289853 [Aspergillus undulatus]|uniref:uncharacterized protein n=1 Tax=Aspergillus undulatus TaxID=1810928 RepID=UPI003CCD24CB
MPVSQNDPILITGAGVFGLSTALELTRRGYTNIAVLDRHVPPVVDGSSVDISRIIRADYAGPIYAQMALEASAFWPLNAASLACLSLPAIEEQSSLSVAPLPTRSSASISQTVLTSSPPKSSSPQAPGPTA